MITSCHQLHSDPAPSVSPIRLAVGSRHTEQARRSCQRAGPSPGPPIEQPREIPCCAACLHRMRHSADSAPTKKCSNTRLSQPALGGRRSAHAKGYVWQPKRNGLKRNTPFPQSCAMKRSRSMLPCSLAGEVHLFVGILTISLDPGCVSTFFQKSAAKKFVKLS